MPHETLSLTGSHLDTLSLMKSIRARTAEARQIWGSQFVPYWGELTPEEQQARWERYLETNHGPDYGHTGCTRCNDARCVHPVGDRGVDYSRVIPCPQCVDWTEEQRLAAIKASGVPPGRRGETLDNFIPQPGAHEALDACAQLARGKAGFSLLLLYGDHGSGKTHLGRGALLEWMSLHPGKSGRYIDVGPFFGHLRTLLDKGEADDAIAAIKQVDFLVVDEMGKENPNSAWQAGVLEDIVNHRYDYGLPTILITNQDVRQLPPAILSRLKDRATSLLVYNSAGDYRAKKGRLENEPSGG